MPEIKPFQTPWESAQALVADHAEMKYGIKNADPLKLITELAFGPSEAIPLDDGTVAYTGPSPELRLAAAKTLLQYTRPQVKALHMQLDGQINVDHTHRAGEAVEKARALLAMLGSNRYESGKVQEAQLLTVDNVPPDGAKH